MRVKRVGANIATDDVAVAKRCYGDGLWLDLLMDHGWIASYGTAEAMDVQVSIASEGGSGTLAPALSIGRPSLLRPRSVLALVNILKHRRGPGAHGLPLCP